VKKDFSYVDLQVENLYSIELKEGESVHDRIISIENFIKSCGWTVEEFEIYREFGDLN